MVDTHTTTNTSSSPSALTAAQHALLDASLFQVRSLLTGTETRADSANDTADNHPDDDQLQTVAAKANPARVSHQLGNDGARHEHKCAGARGRQEARAMTLCNRPGRFARRATSAPPIALRPRAHLEGVRTPMAICSSPKVSRVEYDSPFQKVEHGSLNLSSVVELSSPEMLAVERGSRGEVEHGSPHSLTVELGSRLSVVERGSPNVFNGEYGSQHAPAFVNATQDFERTGHTPEDTPLIADGGSVDCAHSCLQEVKSTVHDVYSAPTTLSLELEMEGACRRQTAQLLFDSSTSKYPVRVEQGSPTVSAIELGSRGEVEQGSFVQEVEQGSLRIEQGSPMSNSNTLVDAMCNDTPRAPDSRPSFDNSSVANATFFEREFQPYIEMEADGRVVEPQISMLRDRKVWRARRPAPDQRTSLRCVTRLGPYRSLYGTSRAVARNRYLPPSVGAFRGADYEYKKLDASASQSMKHEQRFVLPEIVRVSTEFWSDPELQTFVRSWDIYDDSMSIESCNMRDEIRSCSVPSLEAHADVEHDAFDHVENDSGHERGTAPKMRIREVMVSSMAPIGRRSGRRDRGSQFQSFSGVDDVSRAFAIPGSYEPPPRERPARVTDERARSMPPPSGIFADTLRQERTSATRNGWEGSCADEDSDRDGRTPGRAAERPQPLPPFDPEDDDGYGGDGGGLLGPDPPVGMQGGGPPPPGDPLRDLKIKIPTYSGEADLDVFDAYIVKWDFWCALKGIHGENATRMAMYSLKSKALRWYMHFVARDAHRWNMNYIYQGLFEACFPSDFRAQLRDKLMNMKQARRSVKDFAQDLKNLRMRFPEVSDYEVKKIFWDGVDTYIRMFWREKRRSVEWDTLEILLDYADRAEMRENERLKELRREERPHSAQRPRHRRNAPSQEESDTESRSTGSHSDLPESDSKRPDSESDSRHSRDEEVDGIEDTSVPELPIGISLMRRQLTEHRENGLCFNCHKEGHRARECPDFDDVESLDSEDSNNDSGAESEISSSLLEVGVQLTRSEMDEHRIKGLCFNCHKKGHRAFECPQMDDETSEEEVSDESERSSDGESDQEDGERRRKYVTSAAVRIAAILPAGAVAGLDNVDNPNLKGVDMITESKQDAVNEERDELHADCESCGALSERKLLSRRRFERQCHDSTQESWNTNEVYRIGASAITETVIWDGDDETPTKPEDTSHDIVLLGVRRQRSVATGGTTTITASGARPIKQDDEGTNRNRKVPTTEVARRGDNAMPSLAASEETAAQAHLGRTSGGDGEQEENELQLQVFFCTDFGTSLGDVGGRV